MVVGDYRSRPAYPSCGVPQGSVLGPTLFTLYTSPLGSLFDNLTVKHNAFADDVTTVSPITRDRSIISGAESAASAASSWYNQNGMLLNASKSEAMLVGTRAQRSKFMEPLNISISTSTVASSQSLKNFGVKPDAGSACSFHGFYMQLSSSGVSSNSTIGG